MGLIINGIKDVVGAGIGGLSGATKSALWKEYFESGDMSDGILMKRADKIIVGKSKNTKADDNLISSGSGIDVQEGQCMVLVENGKVVEFCAEPGRYTYDSSTAPSLLSGGNKGLKALGEEIKAQWAAGGQRFSTQRVYFINMGEMIYSPIKWGCGDIAFHHTNIFLNGAPPVELDITIKGNGQLTVKIEDPVKFYTTIGAQKAGADTKAIIKITDEGIMSNLKSGIVDKVGEAISMLGTQESVPWTAIKSKTSQIRENINTLLSNEWLGLRGFGVCSFTANSFIPNDEDKEAIAELQKNYTMAANANAANYDIQKTVARGIEAAGQNGGAQGMFGIGMGIGAVGGANLGNLQPQQFAAAAVFPPSPVSTAPSVQGWTCSCGTVNDNKFCKSCGAAKPAPTSDIWICSCGKSNAADTRFCTECGNKKPTAKKIVCDKCGWSPDNNEPVRFCPKCGDVINDADHKD